MSVVDIACDPASKKLAWTIAVDGKFHAVKTRPLPSKKPYRYCYLAMLSMMRLVREYVDQGHTVHVTVEKPFYSPRTAHSALPLFRINGSLLAGAVAGGAASVHDCDIQTWKKTVTGNGNAGKPLVASSLKKVWKVAWDAAPVSSRGKKDQDVLDSAGICFHAIKRRQLHEKKGRR